EAGADDAADRGVLVGAAADGELVEFLALLVEAEDADVADVVMAAGVDAAGDVDGQRPDVVLAPEIREPLRELLGDRDRAGCGKRAVVEAGAGDDVADEAE